MPKAKVKHEPKFRRNLPIIERSTMQYIRVWFNRYGLSATDADSIVFKTDKGFAFYRDDLLALAEQRNRENQVKKAQQFMMLLNFHQLLSRINHD